MGEAKLLELMKKTSNNHIDPDKVRELMAKAENTIPSEILKEYGTMRRANITYKTITGNAGSYYLG